MTKNKSAKNNQGYIAAGAIKDNNGGTRCIFRHLACPIYADDFSKNLADVAKEIQYY